LAFFARILNQGDSEDLRYAGTGFFVGVPSVAIPNRQYHYVVTASHVVDQLSLSDWAMRLNTIDGQSVHLRGTKDHKWWRHTDGTVDIAVAPFPRKQGMDIHAIPLRTFADNLLIAEAGIGPGDEVFTVGLFSRFPGSSQNLPLVRTGNIAMIPKALETIRVNIGRNGVVDAEVYLIESRSIGGQSGSPVFACLTGNPFLSAHRGAQGQYQLGDYFYPGQIFLLGIATGHWDVFADEKNEIYPQAPTVRDHEKKRKS
jgi:hypothetical protein